MAAALAVANEHGGRLIRHAGGFWSWPGCPRHSHNGLPEESFGTTTIQALVDRGQLTYSQWQDGRGGAFPVAVEIVAESASAKE